MRMVISKCFQSMSDGPPIRAEIAASEILLWCVVGDWCGCCSDEGRCGLHGGIWARGERRSPFRRCYTSYPASGPEHRDTGQDTSHLPSHRSLPRCLRTIQHAAYCQGHFFLNLYYHILPQLFARYLKHQCIYFFVSFSSVQGSYFQLDTIDHTNDSLNDKHHYNAVATMVESL